MAQFSKYVSSVQGRLVNRWDTKSLIGAVRNPDGSVTWDTEQITPLPAEFVATYGGELRQCLVGGDLVERTEEQYQSYLEEHG
jgi:hypothetical protein